MLVSAPPDETTSIRLVAIVCRSSSPSGSFADQTAFLNLVARLVHLARSYCHHVLGWPLDSFLVLPFGTIINARIPMANWGITYPHIIPAHMQGATYVRLSPYFHLHIFVAFAVHGFHLLPLPPGAGGGGAHGGGGGGAGGGGDHEGGGGEGGDGGGGEGDGFEGSNASGAFASLGGGAIMPRSTSQQHQMSYAEKTARRDAVPALSLDAALELTGWVGDPASLVGSGPWFDTGSTLVYFEPQPVASSASKSAFSCLYVSS